MRLYGCGTTFILVTFIFFINVCNTYAEKSLHPLSKEFAVCVNSGTETNDISLQTFWRESTGRCNLDIDKLIEHYGNVLANQGDKCSLLLRQHLRNRIINTSSRIYAEALISGTFRNNAEIEQLSERLSKLDSRMAKNVWEDTIDEVYLFVNRTQLAEILYEETPVNINIAALLYLYQKYVSRADVDTRLPVVVVHYLRTIQNNANYDRLPVAVQKGVDKVYEELSPQLQLLYSVPWVGILNKAYWEFLNAPRDDSADTIRRRAITWKANKNSTGNDGDMRIKVRENADLTIGSYYGDKEKYLYVDDESRSAYFWLGEGEQPNRWWRVDWYGEYFTLTNVRTKHLLCAGLELDSNSRLLSVSQVLGDSDQAICHWIVVSTAALSDF